MTRLNAPRARSATRREPISPRRRADLRLEITRAFWALVTAREAEQVLDRSVESLDAHVRDVRARLDQGLIPPNEVLSAEAQRSRERVLAIEARNTRGSVEADLRPPASAKPAVGRSCRRSRSGRGIGESGRFGGTPRRGPRIRGPSVRRFEQRAAAHGRAATAASAAARPQVGIDGGYDYARPNPRIFPAGRRLGGLLGRVGQRDLVAVGRRPPPGRAGPRRQPARGPRKLARGSSIASSRFEVRQRWLDMDSSRAAIAAAADGVRAAVEARRVVGERFRPAWPPAPRCSTPRQPCCRPSSIARAPLPTPGSREARLDRARRPVARAGDITTCRAMPTPSKSAV